MHETADTITCRFLRIVCTEKLCFGSIVPVMVLVIVVRSALVELCIFARNRILVENLLFPQLYNCLTSGLFIMFFRRGLRHQAGGLQIQRGL